MANYFVDLYLWFYIAGKKIYVEVILTGLENFFALFWIYKHAFLQIVYRRYTCIFNLVLSENLPLKLYYVHSTFIINKSQKVMYIRGLAKLKMWELTHCVELMGNNFFQIYFSYSYNLMVEVEPRSQFWI